MIVELDFFSVPGFLNKSFYLEAILLKIYNDLPHFLAQEHIVSAFHQSWFEADVVLVFLFIEFEVGFKIMIDDVLVDGG